MTLYALFHDGEKISKAHTTREAVVIEAYERGAVGEHHPYFPGDRRHTLRFSPATKSAPSTGDQKRLGSN